MNETPENKGSIYEFGKFVLDPRERVLLADGEPVHLSDKVFDTLCVLIQNNGKLLTKDEMMASIWEESFVEEGNLAKNVSRLRKILNTDGLQLIETVPRRGYRFRADVRQTGSGTDMLVHRRLRIKLTQTSGNDDERSTRRSDDEIHSIAVLPFQPLDANYPDDIFGLGITDALITQLNRAGQIQVRPTSSIIKYNLMEQDPVSAGTELQVDAILEGRFQRKENRLRLTLQMLHAATGDSVWADSFNTDIHDIFAVQDQIAGRVAGALTKKLSDEAETRLKRRHTDNVEAFQEYLKGRFYWNKRKVDDLKKAAEAFERAINIDPNFALAYAGIADIYNQFPSYDELTPRDSFPKAKAAALRALELDETLAEAHASLGFTLLNYDWNWGGAEVSFQQAIKLNPNYAMAHLWYGTLLLRQERFAEAIVSLKKAKQLDPSSPMISTWMAEALNYCGETEAAVALHNATLDQFDDFFPAHYHLALIYANSGRTDKARVAAKKAFGLSDEISMTSSLLAVLHITLGENDAAEEILARLLEERKTVYVAETNIAEIYAGLGNNDEALNWLETAYTERDPNLTWLKVDKPYKRLHGDPRFQKLLKNVGLAETEARMLPPAVRKPRSRRLITILTVGILMIAGVWVYWYFFQTGAPRAGSDGPTNLTNNLAEDDLPSWSPDGSKIVFTSNRDGMADIYVMNSDGSGVTQLTFTSGREGAATWSPDGKKIAFDSERDGNTEMYIVDADGKNETRLTFNPTRDAGPVSFSSDGKQIAFARNALNEGQAVYNFDIFTMNVDGSGVKQLTKDPGFDAGPVWSPDGSRILFITDRLTNFEIFSIVPDGSGEVNVSNSPGHDGAIGFTPDGQQIFCRSETSDKLFLNQIYLINLDGTNRRQITSFADKTYWFAYSHQAQKFAFTTKKDGNLEIYTMDALVPPS